MGTHNIYLYKEVDKKYTGYNLKTMELLDCALIEVCAIIRSNTVRTFLYVWVMLFLTHCRLNELTNTIYWKILILVCQAM